MKRHDILLARKRLHLFKHTDIRHAITYKSRCTRSQRVGVNIGKGNNTTPTRTARRRVREKRERRHNGVPDSLAEKNNRNAFPGYDYIGEHLLAEDIGEHLFAKTKSWTSKDAEGKRRRGYKGMRVGEASYPGPMTEDVHESFEERINDRFNSEVLEKMQGLASNYDNWSLDDLDKRGASTGMRVATKDFERKLYASKANVEEAIKKNDRTRDRHASSDQVRTGVDI